MVCDAKKAAWRRQKHKGKNYTMEQMVGALLTAVPMNRYLIPPLHTMLGIGNDIVTKINAFIANKLDRMLATDYNIMGQKYFTQTLVGGDVWRLLKKHGDIIPKIGAIMKNTTLRKPDTVVNIDALIDDFLGKVKEIMGVFELICSLMHKTEQLTDTEQTQFKNLCKRIEKLWREAWPNGHITPKFHMLETHASDQMKEFGCLGDKAEAAIERLHHQCNKADRRLAAMPSWKMRQTAMLRRRRQEELPNVQIALENTILGTKRKQSPNTVDKKQRKIDQVEVIKRAKMDVALNIGVNVLANE